MSGAQTAAVHSFIRHLVTAASNAALYSPEHQQVTRLCSAALASLTEALGSDPEISLLLIDDQLVAAGQPLDNSMYINRLGQALKARGIGHLKLLRGVTPQELGQLVGSLAKAGDARREIRSTEHVRFGKVEVHLAQHYEQEGGGAIGTAETAKPPAVAEIPDEELARFMEIYEAMRKHQKLNVVGMFEIVSGFIEAFRQQADALMSLAPLRVLDEYTFTHSTNVCILNLAQAMALGIDGAALHDIGIAAMLHDIGKLSVPEDVLTKPGRLDDAEWEFIRQHPLKGAQYLLDTPGVPRLAVVTAYEHHMKYDGSGYPQVTPGWQQNLCSQMTTISDVFDALRTKRAYRDSMDFDRIAGMMLEMTGTDLHPLLTRNFLKVLTRISARQ